MNGRGTGSEQYPPSLLLGLLIYSYASGVFSSRQIERATHDSVAVRVLCADTHPDHDTLCTFRRENAALLAAAFAQVLELAAHCGVLQVAGITVAIDGTKILANASKHAAVSYARAGETMRQLDLEVAELLAKAEQADATPLQDGLSVPDEVARRQTRKAKLALAHKLVKFPDAVQAATEQLRPHFLCFYLYELAGGYSSFNTADKVLVDDPPVRARRLLLCARTLLILETGLTLLGLRTLQRM